MSKKYLGKYFVLAVSLVFSVHTFGQSLKVNPVFGFDVSTGRSPTFNIATNPKIISYPVIGAEMMLPKLSEEIKLGVTLKFWENIAVNLPPFPSSPGFELTEQLLSKDIYVRYDFSDKFAMTGGYFSQRRYNILILSTATGPVVDYGVSAGLGINLPKTHISFKTKVFLNDFSALVGTENYEIRIASRILSEKDEAERDDALFSEFFRVGLKFFPSYNLISLPNERAPDISFLPSLGYEVLKNDIGLSLFAEFDLFYRVNFGSAVKDIQQVINTSSFGMKYYFQRHQEGTFFTGLSYAYSKHGNLLRLSRTSNYDIKGIGIHGGYFINDRWSFEVQTLLFLKSARKRLTNVNYAKVGVMYNLPL